MKGYIKKLKSYQSILSETQIINRKMLRNIRFSLLQKKLILSHTNARRLIVTRLSLEQVAAYISIIYSQPGLKLIILISPL